MLVLHAHWSALALRIWAETDTNGGESRESPGAQDAPRHPASAEADALLERLAPLVAWPGGELPLRRGADLLVTLPTPTGRSPLPSPRLSHAGGRSGPTALLEDVQLQVWRVPTVVVDGGNAASYLERLEEAVEDRAARAGENGDPEIGLGPAAPFLAAGARLARSLVAQQRFVPMALQLSDGSLRGAWRPWLSDEEWAQRAATLVSAVPPIACAAVDEHDHQPWSMVESFLNASVDALCRRALAEDAMREAIEDRDRSDLHVAWLSGLLDAPDQLEAVPSDRPKIVRGVRRWISRLDERGEDAEWRLCLTLWEPAEDDGEEAAWRLEFALQSVEKPEALLPASEIWSLSTTDAEVEGQRAADPRELLLGELGRASRLYEPLEGALEETAPTMLELSAAQAYTFLRETQELLREQGFGVVVPEWWGSPMSRLGVRLEVDGGPDQPELAPLAEPPEAADSGLGLNALVDYRWRLAVGETALSLEELEKLASSEQPLIKLEGRWVEVRPEDVRRAIDFIRENPGGQMRVGEVMRVAYGADPAEAGVPVVGLDASGWVARIFGSLDEEVAVPTLTQPEGFVGALRPYQLKGLSWLAFLDRFGLGACLADDMGLGKTIQMLALLAQERERAAETGGSVGPTLLIAPTSVVYNWRREANRFTPTIKTLMHHGVERASGAALLEEAHSADLVITTYALAHRDVEDLSRISWERVVLDEAQNIKNPSAKQTRSIRSLNAPKRVALTGTPVENRLSELWSIMDFCNPSYLGAMGEFHRRFALPIERRHDAHKSRQLRSLVRPFVLRRLKSDPTVTADLPSKLETKERVQLTAEQASLYEAAVKGMLAQVDEAEGIHRRGVVLATLIKLKQICNHPLNLADHEEGDESRPSAARSGKSRRLLEMLEEVIAAGDQALVFTQFRRMGRLLARMIAHDLDTDVLFLHGGTPSKARERMVDRFQEGDGKAPIFLLSLKAGGLGMNLTAANHVFHYDRWWNPAVENQATDRAHRIGQTRTVHVHKFIASGTLEERIDEMIEQKTELADRIIASGERWLTELSTSQLRDLLTLRDTAVSDD